MVKCTDPIGVGSIPTFLTNYKLLTIKLSNMKLQTPTIIKPEFEAFEVYHEDLEGHYTWREAKKACAKLGAGWRLPTKEELEEMYEKRDMVGGFANNDYWSYTENDTNNAWSQNFSNGNQYSLDKNDYISVRAVRNINH